MEQPPSKGPLGGQKPAPTAKVLNCPSCGAGIAIHAPGQTVSVACRACGSVLDATNSEALSIIYRAAKAQAKVEPLIPLGQKGKLRGQVWQCIGFMQRCDGGGIYCWREYLLFNPMRGYRWLTEFDGHWNYVTPTKERPSGLGAGGRPSSSEVSYLGRRYRKFHEGKARVSFVLGEFYWRVAVGETVSVEDYVSPPEMLSCERSPEETIWSIGEYLEPSAVKEAFQVARPMPRPQGVAPNQLSWSTPLAGRLAGLCGMFLVIAFLIQLVTTAAAPHETVFQGAYRDKPTDADRVKVTPPFQLTRELENLEVTLHAPVHNDWFEVSFTLSNEDTGDSIDFEQGVEYYTGYDSDGSWSEGSQWSTQTLSALPKGTYTLVIAPGGAMQPPAAATNPAPATGSSPAPEASPGAAPDPGAAATAGVGSAPSASPSASPVQAGQPQRQQTFWPNGKLKTDETFVDGRREGLSLSYDENGAIRSSYEYHQGLRHGRFSTRNADETLQQEGTYAQGQLHGEVRTYAPNGKQYVSQFYRDGSPTAQKPPEWVDYTVRVVRGVPIWSNFFWAVVLLMAWPGFVLWRKRKFEMARWSTSDFSPYWSQTEDE